VQGRLDTICPPQTAHALAQAMPHANLQLIEGAGHSAFEPGIADALMAALESVR
jgi:proline iminopeptidase